MNSMIQYHHHIAISKGIPGIGHGILGKAYVDSVIIELLYPGQTSSLRIGILSALQINIFCGTGYEIESCFEETFS